MCRPLTYNEALVGLSAKGRWWEPPARRLATYPWAGTHTLYTVRKGSKGGLNGSITYPF